MKGLGLCRGTHGGSNGRGVFVLRKRKGCYGTKSYKDTMPFEIWEGGEKEPIPGSDAHCTEARGRGGGGAYREKKSKG